MKRIVSIVLLLIIVASSLSLGAFAEEATQDRETIKLFYDIGDLITDIEEQELEGRLQALSREYGLDIVVLAVNDAQGKDTLVYANDFYESIQFSSDATVFIMDMDNRNIEIVKHGLGLEIFADQYANAILDTTLDTLIQSESNIYQTSSTYIDEVDRELKDWKAGFIKSDEAVPTVESAGLIHDIGEYLTDTEEQNLAQRLEVLSVENEISLIVLTIKDALGRTSVEYADEFYANNDFSANAAIFVMDMDNRRIEIVKFGTGYEIFTDANADYILDPTLATLNSSGENLYATAKTYIEKAEEVLEDWQVYLHGAEPATIGEIVGKSFIGGAIASVVALIVMMFSHNKSIPNAISAQNYMPSGLALKAKKDHFANTFTSRTRRPKDDSSGGGGGGGGGTNFSGRSSHSSGRSFGGGSSRGSSSGSNRRSF